MINYYFLKDFLNWLEKAGAGTDGVILTSHEQVAGINQKKFLQCREEGGGCSYVKSQIVKKINC